MDLEDNEVDHTKDERGTFFYCYSIKQSENKVL